MEATAQLRRFLETCKAGGGATGSGFDPGRDCTCKAAALTG